METNTGLTKEQINYLCEAANEYFTRPVIERGWKLYHEQAVTAGWFEDGSIFAATVRDGELYRIKIDFDFFVMSECECGAANCKHLAAAFLQLYRLQGGRPELFLKEFLQNEMSRPVKLANSPRKTVPSSNPLPTPKSIKQQQEKARRQEAAAIKVTETSTTEQWHEYFAQLFVTFKTRMQENFDAHFPELQQQAERCTASWPKPLADLYKVHLLLDLLGRIDEMYRTTQTSFYAYYYMNRLYEIGEKITERVVNILSKTDRQAIRNEYAERLEETAKKLNDYLCSNPRTVMSLVFIYRYMWWNLLHSAPLCEKETVRLQRRLKQPGMPVQQLDIVRLGIIHMHFIEGREEEALTGFAGDLASREAGYLATYLQFYLQTKQWDKLLRWLKWMIPYLKDGESEFLDPYFDYYWTGYVKGSGDTQNELEAMRQLLPHTYERYDERLMRMGDYRRWVDLQMAIKADPDRLEASDLRKVGSAQMRLLLPLYHQSIERHIENKNRESYKTAVYYLVKLRDCYYKIKSPQLWNAYLDHMREKYSRLRALQEEMKKGKLIS
jgi:hypothetical protein